MNPPGDPDKQKLYQELMDFRKLMLCYRLIHYFDHIQDIDTGLRNRDKELGGPLLRLFHDAKVYAEIKYALDKFLSQRKNRKQSTIESALQPFIGQLLAKANTSELYVAEIWNALPNNIPGRFNPQDPNEYQTKEYGALHRNTLSQQIVDGFGAVRKRKNNGIVLIFDEEKINELRKRYEALNQDKAKAKDAAPKVFNEPTEIEDNNTLEDDSEGSERSEGSRICGFIIE
jgi:hypothetical protein